MAMFGNTKSLAYHESNSEDPYITMQDDEEEKEEREELQILATDNMLVAAKVEDEVAYLEIYVYEDEADNLYVHHDIMLPAIPLCVEWLDIAVSNSSTNKSKDQSSKANYVAVGTFEPDIEIWDLDTVDCMYPNAILGRGGDESKAGAESAKGKKKRKRSKKADDDYHVDAVLSLAANRNHRTLLASASADKTVKLWDLSTAKCAKSYSYHTDKVCSIEWHPKQTTVLLSGSYDRTIVAADMRAPDAKAPRWGVESDIEAVRWDPHDPNCFYATTENGVVHYHDTRNVPSTVEKSNPLWKLQAHDASLSSFDINPIIPGFLVTGSTDKEVKLWNVQPSGPTMVVSRNFGVGKVFSTKFAPDKEVGFRLAVAGSKGAVQIWDTSTNPAVRHAFANRVAPVEGDVQERLVALNEDSSESEDESEDDEETGEADHVESGGDSMDED
jgi:periodic tryptophan protein 1